MWASQSLKVSEECGQPVTDWWKSSWTLYPFHQPEPPVFPDNLSTVQSGKHTHFTADSKNLHTVLQASKQASNQEMRRTRAGCLVYFCVISHFPGVNPGGSKLRAMFQKPKTTILALPLCSPEKYRRPTPGGPACNQCFKIWPSKIKLVFNSKKVSVRDRQPGPKCFTY